MLRKETQTVMGHTLRSPRITKAGFRMMLLYAVLPMMAVLGALDGILYLFFRYVLGSCYGVWCLF